MATVEMFKQGDKKNRVYRLLWLFLPLSLVTLIGCQAGQSLQATATDSPVSTNTVESIEPTDSPTQIPVETSTVAALNTPTPEIVELPKDETMIEGTANADVEFVRAVQAADGIWTFHVTVRHPDTGWEDYADGWDVLLPDDSVLKPTPADPFTRLLLHPHENEQPFTRSQGGIIIPGGVTQVTVRAHDIVDGFGGREVILDLSVEKGQGFEVER